MAFVSRLTRISLFLVIAMPTCSASADVVHWWRFEEEADFLTDSVGGVVLEQIGSPVRQVTIPSDGRGTAFPMSFGELSNQSSADFTSALGGLQSPDGTAVDGDFTIELLFNGRHFDQSTSGINLVTQAKPTYVNPAGFGWTMHIQRGGFQRSFRNELIVVLSNGSSLEAMKSGILINEDTDYSIRADFSVNQSRVAFHVHDLDRNTLEVSHVDYEQGGLNESNWILVGDLPNWNVSNSSAFPTNGLIDEVRISNEVVELSESFQALAESNIAAVDSIAVVPRSIYQLDEVDPPRDLSESATVALSETDRIASRFELPEIRDVSTLAHATFRVQGRRLSGVESEELSLWHNPTDNEIEVDPSDFEDSGYLRIDDAAIVAGQNDRGYFEFDVTDAVKQSYHNEDTPVTAFRLQTSSQDSRLSLTMMRRADARPELVLYYADAVFGDFDGNGLLEASDVDALIRAIGTAEPQFDLNFDGDVDETDLTKWVKQLKNTWIGDANLDGEFNSADLTLVFQSGKYESMENATWSTGDWNGDGVFGTGDLVAAFNDGGYERGQRAVRAVPEPSGFPLIVIGIFISLHSANRHRNRGGANR